MGEVLEFNEIEIELCGVMIPIRLKVTEQQIMFKNSKTGKVEHIALEEIERINSEKSVDVWGLRVFTKQFVLYRFRGFQEHEMKKLSNFIKHKYGQKLEENELSVKGFNWGVSNFEQSVLNVDDKDNKSMFEVPLKYVSQCLTGKNEVTLEFHQNDDTTTQLKKMRFYISSTDSQTEDPVENFQRSVMSNASVISATGDAIAIFRKIHCLTPRSRYDMKIFKTFFQLHGKTFDYTIPMTSVLRLFLVPHKDKRQMFFVLSLHPPITQGQTRYHFLVLLFGLDELITIELPFTEKELEEKYNHEIKKELSGPVYEVFGKVLTVLVGRKITGAGKFVGHSGTAAIGCSFKAAAGYLYPLESGFLYVHKPPIYIRFEEIASVNFARSGGNTRSFDLEVTLDNGSLHIFSSIEKEEYNKLYTFIQTKNLRCSNICKQSVRSTEESISDSNNENEPDAYLARIKADTSEVDSNDEESTDEEFKPNDNESDVDEEYDSNLETNSSDDSSSSDSEASFNGDSETELTDILEKKENNKMQTSSPEPVKTAFKLWLSENAEKIKNDNPDTKPRDILMKASKMWKDLKDKSKWVKMEAKDEERFLNEDKINMAGSDNKAMAKRKLEKSSSKKSTKLSGSPDSANSSIDSDKSLSEGVNKKLKV